MDRWWRRYRSGKSLMCRAGVGFLRERKEIMKWRMLQIYGREIGNVPTNVLRDYIIKTSNVYIICLCSETLLLSKLGVGIILVTWLKAWEERLESREFWHWGGNAIRGFRILPKWSLGATDLSAYEITVPMTISAASSFRAGQSGPEEEEMPLYCMVQALKTTHQTHRKHLVKP